ncbi:MAG: CarD family transcriptional regulator [Anaerovoracaceae bacterium]|nr:CarD family transcriptional regulator [Bacillota bacterium]MEE0517796.1 CarD family transcriptional regulator [Anaerovoracaceae bacterium]
MFSVGSKIVHPMHGAGIIQKIEEKRILGNVKKYYILKLPCNDMNVMIPVDSEESVGIRKIMDKSVVRRVIEYLGTDSTHMDSNWNRRYRENMQKIKSGDIFQVAEVVKNLIRASREKGLSAGETKMLNNARQILISEIILSCGISQSDAEKIVEDAV